MTQSVLDKGYRAIVSESETFYIGNTDWNKIDSFVFPDSKNVLGFEVEVVRFISERDEPFDLEQRWL